MENREEPQMVRFGDLDCLATVCPTVQSELEVQESGVNATGAAEQQRCAVKTREKLVWVVMQDSNCR